MERVCTESETAYQTEYFIYNVDDMGYGDLGCSYISTPNLDAMAGEGMRFTQAYAIAM